MCKKSRDTYLALLGVFLILLFIGTYQKDERIDKIVPAEDTFVSSFTATEQSFEPALPVIAGYDNPSIDDLPALTMDGSHLEDIEGYEPLEVHELPNLED